MNFQRVWVKRVGDCEAPLWGTFITSLREQRVCCLEDAPDLALPALVFFHGHFDAVQYEVALQRSQRTGPIFVLALHTSDLAAPRAWQLIQAGADDVFSLSDFKHPAAAIAGRLLRLTEIDTLINSDVVKENLVGASPGWLQVIRQAVEVARFSDTSLLITGESGTGKELVARLVHTLDSRSDKGKLVVLDCTTVQPELSGSEFFGHERGSFTNAVASREGAFALAHNGTLFLDEVGELPLALQAELLRAIQERHYKRVGSNHWQKTDFRLVCATNRDLAAEEAKGNFRLDFYHRIACSRCHLPPLRERRADILPLAQHFLTEFLPTMKGVDFSPAVQDFLMTRRYPGNVRELRQLVLRMARRYVPPGPITIGAIPEEDRLAAFEAVCRDWRDAEFQNAIRRALASGIGLQDIKEQTIEAVIQIALDDTSGNIQRAAIKLGVTDRALQMRRAARKTTDDLVRSRRITRMDCLPPASRDLDARSRPEPPAR